MFADKKKIGYRQRPDLFLPVGIRKNSSCIRLFVIASELCENLVEADPDRTCELEFILHTVPYLECNLFGLIVTGNDAGHVEPALIKSEGFDFVRIFRIHLTELPGIEFILLVMGIHKNQIRTFCLRLPDGFGGLDPVLFCRFIFGKDYAVPGRRITGNCHRDIPKFRLGDHLNRCKIAVLVNVKNDAFHAVYNTIKRTYFLF